MFLATARRSFRSSSVSPLNTLPIFNLPTINLLQTATFVSGAKFSASVLFTVETFPFQTILRNSDYKKEAQAISAPDSLIRSLCSLYRKPILIGLMKSLLFSSIIHLLLCISCSPSLWIQQRPLKNLSQQGSSPKAGLPCLLQAYL